MEKGTDEEFVDKSKEIVIKYAKIGLDYFSKAIRYSSYIGNWLADSRILAGAVGAVGGAVEGRGLYVSILQRMIEVDPYSTPWWAIAVPSILVGARAEDAYHNATEALMRKMNKSNIGQK